jgi:hypothetical protein
LYDTKDGCCDNHQDVSCLLTVPSVVTPKPSPVITKEPTSKPVEKVKKWYPLDGQCVFDANYPGWMAAGINVYTYLFSTNQDCCNVHGCREKKWWPVKQEGGGFECEFNNDYHEEFVGMEGEFQMLFDTYEGCCNVFCGLVGTSTTSTEGAPAITTTTARTTTTTTTTTTMEEMVQNSATIAPPFDPTSTSSCESQKWHISTLPNTPNTCTNDKVYPSAWDSVTGYLFTNSQDCCNAFFSGKECIATNVCVATTTTTTTTTTIPEEEACGKKWHMSILSNGLYTCTNDNIYPSEWPSQMLLSTSSECCSKFFPDQQCRIINHCACHSNWHISISPGESNVCTNDENYPTSWKNQPHVHLFHSVEECCAENFGEGEECGVRDACEVCVDSWHVNPDMPGGSW